MQKLKLDARESEISKQYWIAVLVEHVFTNLSVTTITKLTSKQKCRLSFTVLPSFNTDEKPIEVRLKKDEGT